MYSVHCIIVFIHIIRSWFILTTIWMIGWNKVSVLGQAFSVSIVCRSFCLFVTWLRLNALTECYDILHECCLFLGQRIYVCGFFIFHPLQKYRWRRQGFSQFELFSKASKWLNLESFKVILKTNVILQVISQLKCCTIFFSSVFSINPNCNKMAANLKFVKYPPKVLFKTPVCGLTVCQTLRFGKFDVR